MNYNLFDHCLPSTGSGLYLSMSIGSMRGTYTDMSLLGHTLGVPSKFSGKAESGRMSEREILLSPEGKKNLEEELNYLKLVRRKEVAERIKTARSFGDLSENAEYEDAKNEQAFVEGRIMMLEKILRHAKVTDDGAAEPDVVNIGSVVTVKDLSAGKVYEYTIVGSQEADPAKKRISNESPVGRALLGQKVGSIVSVVVPAGTFKYEIISVHH